MTPSATNFKVGANLTFTFSGPVEAGSGYLTLTGPDGKVVQKIDFASGRAVINGNVVTVDLPQDLAYRTEYRIDLNGWLKSGGLPVLAPSMWIKTEGVQIPVEATGGIGNDEMYGGGKGDRLDGAEGDDVLAGMEGDDTLLGSSGDDELYGQEGNDTLVGGDGNDILYDELGDNTMKGGAGNDRIYSYRAGRNLVDCGEGDDFAQSSTDDTVYGGAGNDRLSIVGDSGLGGSAHGGDGDDQIELDLYSATGAGYRLWGDGGRDTYVFYEGEMPGATGLTIEDFTTGAAGDVLDIEKIVRPDWRDNAMPLGTNGTIELLQSGRNTDIVFRAAAPDGVNKDYVVATLRDVQPGQLTAENFGGHYTPHGAELHGITLNGTSGNDLLDGFLLDDVLQGGAGNDQLTGYGGRDILVGGAGDDRINGASGFDSAIYAGNRASFVITAGPYDGNWSVTDLSGKEGKDDVWYTERLQFSDGAVALDAKGNAGKVYRLYQAAFDRKPDAGGVGFWITQVDKGVGMLEVAQGFVNSHEFKQLYGAAPSNQELVARLYQNVLHRAGEKSGADFWLGVLDKKMATVAEVLASFSESPENVAAVAKVIGAGFDYTPWVG
jgi:Ca2+-binding RTX toxin-like protein